MLKPKLKILIIQGYGFQRGGTITSLRYLIKTLDKSKFDPVLLFLSQGELVEEFQKQKINVKVINSGRLGNIVLFGITIFRVLYLIYKEKIDIVFSNDAREHIYGGVAAWFKGIPATFFWHSFLPHAFFIRLVFFIPGIVLIYNKKIKTSIESYGKKVFLIHAGVEIPNVTKDYKELLKEINVEKSIPIITQVSLLMVWKGQEYFIKSAVNVLKIFPTAKFLIVGDTPLWLSASYEKKLRELVKKLHLEKSVVFMGYRKDIFDIIHMSDIVVHPVIAPEPFGFVVVEAMGMGKPVVVSKIGTPEDIIENGMDGILVPPQNSEAISEAVLKLLKNKEFCEKIGKKAKEKVEKYFQVDKMTREFEKVWENLVR